ncbi:hydrogenase [Paraburkholderia phymatum]|uniref:Hydrogenase n=1 Tax=Paraburkholderia phymatum TaxID=148447 RepID=A0ACC6UBH0_9BURK
MTTTQGTSAASTLECLRERLLNQGFLELQNQFGPDSFRAAFAIPPASAAIANRFGVLRHPTLIFLREGCCLGAIEGLRDWQDYLQCFTRMRTELPQPVPIQLTVYGARS